MITLARSLQLIRAIHGLCLTVLLTTLTARGAEWRKLHDFVVYEDNRFYAAFPSIVRLPNGELLVAFRRAPEWRALGDAPISHTDPNSYLVGIRSTNAGRTWSANPTLIFAHPFAGSQDPCLLQLRNGQILCASYAWSLLQPEAIAKLKQPIARHGNFVFVGGFLLRSGDGGQHWSEPIIPPPTPGNPNHDIFGKPLPAYNRGAMVEGKSGELYWAVAAGSSNAPSRSGVHLLVSSTQGNTWRYVAPIAQDSKIDFNETSLYETPMGDLVAFVRSENFNDQTVIARSSDQGKTFQWRNAGFQGHPHHAIRLADQRVLLVYGYRHPPFGIRARILNAECSEPDKAPEIVLRDDGGNGDLGYPWAVETGENRVLVVYYFNKTNGTRHIAGTWLGTQ